VKNPILHKFPFHGFSFWILLGALLGAFAAGFAILLIPSSIAPLLVAGFFAACAFLIVSFLKPVIALYVALFFSLLPPGIIQAESIHSWLNRGLLVLALVAWIFGVITRKEKIKWFPTSILTLVFLGWAMISLLWANDIIVSAQQFQVYLSRFIIFMLLIPIEINSRQRLNEFMKVVALVGLVLVLASIWILLTKGYSPGVRFTIFNVNENMVGVAAMLTLAGVLWQAVQPRAHKWLWNLLAGAYLLFAIGITAISGSRGSTISLMVTIAVFFLWKSTRRWAILALIFLLIAVILFPAMFTTMVERFLLTQGDTLMNGREFTWQASWKVIETTPLIGVGIGGARFAIIPYLSHLLSDQLTGAAVHNPILTIWVETGLIGLLIYLSIPFSAIFSYVANFRTARREEDKWILPYFAIITSIACGYLFSWYVGGGLQADFSYFLILGFFILPECISEKNIKPVHNVSPAIQNN
jgi:putative inorganic carbon (hco3(-)) transporter